MKYEAILCAAPPSLNMRMRCVYQNTDAEAAMKKCLHWESICIMVAFLHCLCLEKQRSSLCRWRLHFLYFPFAVELLFMFACLAPICVFVCLSDPCVAPSPAYSFPTPYQKRERTLNARMYHQRQFSFHSPCFFCFLLHKMTSQPLIDEAKILKTMTLIFFLAYNNLCNQWCKLTWNQIFCEVFSKCIQVY